jgi:hypothetical protein
MAGQVPTFRHQMHGGMQLRAERFEDDATLHPTESPPVRIGKTSASPLRGAPLIAHRLAVIPGRALFANPESRNSAPLLDSGSAPRGRIPE